MTAAQLNSSLLHRYDAATQYEWLETNGLGGYASSTVIGTHTRRYHGLLASARNAPVNRQILLSRLDETLFLGDESYDLSTVKYEGAIYPRGYIFQNSFRLGYFPSWEYELHGIKLRKTLFMPNGMDAVVIIYQVEAAEQEFTMGLRPLLSPRSIHDLTFANPDIEHNSNWDGHTWQASPYGEDTELTISIEGAHYEHKPSWYYRFAYTKEEQRGMESIEDLFTYGQFYKTLSAGDSFGVIVSGQGFVSESPNELYERELERRKKLLADAPFKAGWAQRLVLSADQFIAQRGAGHHTVIAGYPWFTDWGRDTMIALPGLCLATGRPEIAKDILTEFSHHISEGMIPNRFPDDADEPEYNTIDASLWFFIACYQYVQSTKDREFAKSVLLPSMEKIISAHIKGTRYGIKMTEDQLLTGGEAGVQLTWMDAKVDDWVVTPREGKSVEINALWYNAWRIYAEFLKLNGESDSARAIAATAKSIKKSFGDLFWNEEAHCLFDYVDHNGPNASVRPNQIFAVSLPFSLLSQRKAELTLLKVEQELYTPNGLRSLSPNDPEYIGIYTGDRYARDGAYHQGTVWSWLLGPYMDALIKVRGEKGRLQAADVLTGLISHLYQAGVGSISEIFDGDFPHHARGCFAQAWSIAEPLRILHQYDLADSIFEPVGQPEEKRVPHRNRINGRRLPTKASRLTLTDVG